MIAIQESLEMIASRTQETTAKLDAVLGAAKKQEAIIVLLADCRDIITTAVQRFQIRTPDPELQAQLASILDCVQEPLRRVRPWWLWPALLTLVLLVGVGVGWHTCGCPVPLPAPAPLVPAPPAKGARR